MCWSKGDLCNERREMKKRKQSRRGSFRPVKDPLFPRSEPPGAGGGKNTDTNVLSMLRGESKANREKSRYRCSGDGLVP